MGFHGDFMGFHGDFMGSQSELMGFHGISWWFNGISWRFTGDLVGFNVIFHYRMVPPSFLENRTWNWLTIHYIKFVNGLLYFWYALILYPIPSIQWILAGESYSIPINPWFSTRIISYHSMFHTFFLFQGRSKPFERSWMQHSGRRSSVWGPVLLTEPLANEPFFHTKYITIWLFKKH